MDKIHKGRREREKEEIVEEHREEEDGTLRPRKRLREGNETQGRQEAPREERRVREGTRIQKEFQLCIPVLVKMERINKRMREDQKEAGWTPKHGRKTRPTGKERLLQPTLSSFLSLRSGHEGFGGKRGQAIITSTVPNLEVTGRGLSTGPTEGDLHMFGEGGRKDTRKVPRQKGRNRSE